MAEFHYKGLDSSGKPVKGTIEAPDEHAAAVRLKSSCPVILELTSQKQAESFLSMEIGKQKISLRQLSVMCSQFSIILESGIAIDRCIRMIGQQMKNKRLRAMMEQTADKVGRGGSIADSFRDNVSGLPTTFIETVRAGEESGALAHSFGSLHKYYEKSHKTSQKVKQALAYPIFVLMVAIVVLAVIMIKVVPTMISMFADLGGELPAITKMLIATSDFFVENTSWMVMVLVLLALIFKIMMRVERGRLAWAKLQLKIPVIGNIIRLNASVQFAYTMHTMLTSGLSLSRALEVTGKVMDNYLMQKELLDMTGEIEEGRHLGECMRRSNTFPPLLQEMCALGEESGELEATLDTIGDFFDNEAQNATMKAVQMLEPTLLVLMALFAGFIVLAIYIPMFNMYDLM